MADTIEFRAPTWWLVGGVASAIASPVLWVIGELPIGMAVVGLVLGVAMVFVWSRAFVTVDDVGVTWSPNGFRTFHADWAEIVNVQHRRVLFGSQRVTVPPLAGDPLGRIEAEMKYRHPE